MEIKTLIVGSISTNCFLIFSEQEVAIIDPGGNPGKILQEIKKSGNILKYIILTHSHLDHISAAQEIRQKTGAKILTHRIEKYSLSFKPDILLEDYNPPTASEGPSGREVGGSGSRSPKDEWAPKDEIKIGDVTLKVLHTPGHTPGSICLLGKDFVFTGDTLFKEGTGRTDLPSGSSKYLQESLQRLLEILKPGMKIYPGHGEVFEYKTRE